MADEIAVAASLRCVKDNFNFGMQIPTTNFDQTGVGGGGPGTLSIGTSEEDVSFGDITPGWCMLVNLDATNFVKYGPKNASNAMEEFGRLLPGGGCGLVYIASGVTLRMVADTAACLVRISAIAQ